MFGRLVRAVCAKSPPKFGGQFTVIFSEQFCSPADLSFGESSTSTSTSTSILTCARGFALGAFLIVFDLITRLIYWLG